MLVTVASFKGGVAKTTTAVHIAAYLHMQAPTLLLDADKTRNALEWSTEADGFPFTTAPYSQATKLAGRFTHVVLDTGQRPEGSDLKEIVEACDLLIVPAAPGSLDTRSLVQSIVALRHLQAEKFRVLMTKVPPLPETDGAKLRSVLQEHKVPMFLSEIPRLKAFEKAAAAGVTVDRVEDRNAARAWASYYAVGKEIL